MDDLNPLQFSATNFGSAEGCNAAGEFHAVKVTNADDFSGFEVAVTARDSRRQKALAAFAQRFLRTRIHNE